MSSKYSNEQLFSIIEQAMIYQCACPAQISKLALEIQDLHLYQARCENETDIDRQVHQVIAEATKSARVIIEQCLGTVLELEGWNPETLQMPEYLQKRLLAAFETSMGQ